MDIEIIARVCHEANKALCDASGEGGQQSWDFAPEWQRQSAMQGVQFVIDNPTAPASAQHDNWMAVKLADGWKYGSVKDADIKEHPCLVPFDQLPAEQRAKDYLFQAIVKSLINAI